MTKEEIAKQISKNLREQLTKKQGEFDKIICKHCNQNIPNPYTQIWLANEIGSTKAGVAHFFQAKRIPNIEKLVKIAHALDCSVSDLVKDLTYGVNNETIK